MKPDNLRKQGANSGGLESTDEEAKFLRALSNRGRFFLASYESPFKIYKKILNGDLHETGFRDSFPF